MGTKHVALTWTTDDVRNALENRTSKEILKFSKEVGSSDDDLINWLDCTLNDFQDEICSFINELIDDAVETTIKEDVCDVCEDKGYIETYNSQFMSDTIERCDECDTIESDLEAFIKYRDDVEHGKNLYVLNIQWNDNKQKRQDILVKVGSLSRDNDENIFYYFDSLEEMRDYWGENNEFRILKIRQWI